MATANKLPQPALPGFESIRRYWDGRFGMFTARVNPGDVYVTMTDESINTVLGSCIATCLRDPFRGIGGMNHFMLPEAREGTAVSAACYGVAAMEQLINGVLANGGRKKRLQAKIFGGSDLFRSAGAGSHVGDSNIRFVREFLRDEGITVESEDVGGTQGRQVIYLPLSGKAFVKSTGTKTALRQEKDYRDNLTSNQWSGDVELF